MLYNTESDLYQRSRKKNELTLKKMNYEGTGYKQFERFLAKAAAQNSQCAAFLIAQGLQADPHFVGNLLIRLALQIGFTDDSSRFFRQLGNCFIQLIEHLRTRDLGQVKGIFIAHSHLINKVSLHGSDDSLLMIQCGTFSRQVKTTQDVVYMLKLLRCFPKFNKHFIDNIFARFGIIYIPICKYAQSRIKAFENHSESRAIPFL